MQHLAADTINWQDVQHALEPFSPLLWVVAYIVGGFVVHFVLRHIIHKFVQQIVSGVKKRRGVADTQAIAVRSPLSAVRTVQRTRTIGSVLQNILSVVVVITVTVLIIAKLDPSILASLSLLSAAIGAGLGFGAQRIVGDVLNGLFMVLEDQLGVGDEVDMGLAAGVVEKVGVRVTQVRDLHGTLWFVRNGEVKCVGSDSQGWNRVVLDLAVPYEEDTERVKQLMLDTAKELAHDPEWLDRFIEEPEMWGLETLSAEAVVVRLVMKTRAGQRWDAERELRERMQAALKREGITLPPLNTLVFDGPNGYGARASDGATASRPEPAARAARHADPLAGPDTRVGAAPESPLRRDRDAR